MSASTLQVLARSPGAPLSRAQKRFNTLVRQIGKVKETLDAWPAALASFRQSHRELITPLQAELRTGERERVVAMDAALERRSWTQSERELLQELLCDAAWALLPPPADDPELKALFDKHSDADFDTEQREHLQRLKEETEAATGRDLGGTEEGESAEDLLSRLEQALFDQIEAEQVESDARPERRGKTAAQLRRDAEAKQATQSMRELYRKLASALHPDREPDAQQRIAKTALMQRANQAYEANDLLGLLELQLQIEQIDAGQLAAASEERLLPYNTVLAEQLAELRSELSGVELDVCLEFGLHPDTALNPRRLGVLLSDMVRALREARVMQRQQIQMLGNVAATKRWLRNERDQRLMFGSLRF